MHLACRAATTADAYSKFLRPRADAAGARGYHLAAGLDGEVGPATVHVVHAHDRPVLELIDTLLTVAADGPDAEAPKDFPNNETFFHVDVLVNVVPDPGGPPDDRCAVAAAGIAAVGRTLVVSSPWDRPAWTAEARCLFEAYAGLRTVARTPPAAVSANRRVGTSTSTGVAACRGGSSTMAGRYATALNHPTCPCTPRAPIALLMLSATTLPYWGRHHAVRHAGRRRHRSPVSPRAPALG